MNKLCWALMPLLALGCGSETNRGQIGFAPVQDTSIITTSDMGTDVSVADMTPDLVVEPDAAILDMSVDAAPDAMADADNPLDMAKVCWGERSGLTSGLPCGDTGTVGPCNLVTQTGCQDQKYCTFVFNGGGLVTACTSVVAQCGFLKFDEVCSERVDQTTRPLGTCEPGSYCPNIGPTATQAKCVSYCELKTGLGCAEEEVCVQIISGQSAQSLAGYGECSTSKVCAL